MANLSSGVNRTRTLNVARDFPGISIMVSLLARVRSSGVKDSLSSVVH